LPKPKKLVTYGIYSKFRNPIYIGLSLTVIGWSLLIADITFYIITLFIVISCILRAKLEEKVLEGKFGKNYDKYKRKTWI